MIHRLGILFSLTALFLLACLVAEACCTAGPKGKAVINADQTVIIIWDPVNKMQHFIRQASFKSEADDFGFLVPSPTQPELYESDNEAFKVLQRLTEPEIKYEKRTRVTSDKSEVKSAKKEEVKVLDEKLVAGFHAAVLETDSAAALVKWLKDNGYAFSPEVEAWARPYIEVGWKITALKVAKDKESRARQTLTSAALRMSFKTDRPLFPYREPDYKSAVDKLLVHSRLLRIFFISDARYDGELTPTVPWTGKAAWAGKVSKDQRKTVLEHLKLPDPGGPADWYLTEFEDYWPYKVAPADVYFARSANQVDLRREPITHIIWVEAGPMEYWGVTIAIAGICCVAGVGLVFLYRRFRTGSST